MKARRRPFAGTLDSLMDTTTNVVGILVIVLVITQLGVSSAVNRIRSSLPEVSVEELEKQKNETNDLRAMAAKMSEGTDAIESQVAIDESLVESAKATIEKLSAELAVIELAISQAERANLLVEGLAESAKDLQAQLAAALQEEAALKAKLAAAPTAPAPAPKEVNLPNPRSAPKGASALVVFCTGNRALALPQEGLQNLAEARIRQLRLPMDKDGAVDGSKLVEYFERVDVGNRQFRLRVRLYNFVPYLVFEPRAMAGDTIEAMHKGESSVGVELHRADAKKQFARFLVWSDSFDAYAQARVIADQAKLPAGWEPMLPNQVYQVSLAGVVKVQRPPPPPPPPKDPPPPPPPVKPPAGEPPIAPPKPPLPKDDID